MKLSAIGVIGLLLSPVAGASAQDVNDEQIASIAVAANEVDVDAGKLAVARSTRDDFKAFGQLMITDHTGVNKAATALVTRLKVIPQDSPTSQSLKAGGEKNLAHLKTLERAAFDKAYVDHEVGYHQLVIDSLDKTLIPGATNEELKALLVKVRPAFVAHLNMRNACRRPWPRNADRAYRHSDRRSGPDLVLDGRIRAGQNAEHKTRTVTMKGMRFEPDDLTVAVGDTIVWVNEDLVPLTATSESGGFDSKAIEAGKSWRYTVSEKGDFACVCTFHLNMKAVLHVK